jgi:hypothetical protein
MWLVGPACLQLFSHATRDAPPWHKQWQPFHLQLPQDSKIACIIIVLSQYMHAKVPEVDTVTINSSHV